MRSLRRTAGVATPWKVASADGGRRDAFLTLGLCVFSDQRTHTHDKHVRMYRVGLRVFLRACPLRMYVQGGLWVFLLACPLRMYVWSFTYMSCPCHAHVLPMSPSCHIHDTFMLCSCHHHDTFTYVRTYEH